MILVTVGTQLAFDRMVGAVDRWVNKKDIQVIAQVGPTEVCFSNIKYKSFLEQDELDHILKTSDLVVAHAGMGSILSSLSLGKPIIIMPRKASLGEHRNEHQMATARRFQNRPGVYVAWDEQQLVVLLNRWSTERFDHVDEISNTAPTEFLANLKQLIGNT
ncbi:MAG: glucuronosyltransferase [Candidatus Thiodiazotropha sp. 'RUGA']|nr:glucuronosyltransferase [Candidatus Thiodiazotropha sp. 'RUGA']